MNKTSHLSLCLLSAAAIFAGSRPAQPMDEAAAAVSKIKLPTSGSVEALERANPVRPLPETPLGHDQKLTDLPSAPDVQKARLGKWLFFDPRLSPGAKNSCEKCHHSAQAWSADVNLPMEILGRKVVRRTQSFVNCGFSFYPEQFWDGRSLSLEEQPKGPKLNVAGIAAIPGYGPFFEKSFGKAQVTTEAICKALADYERTRMSGNSPWDRWRRLGDEKAVGADAKLGDKLFFGKARCATCHVATVLSDPKFAAIRAAKAREEARGVLHLVGNSFTDWRFHNTGVGYDAKKKDWSDHGRAMVTQRKEDRGAFKTPPLRDVALHPPYMHDGSIATLEAVIEHYSKGGVDNPYLDPLMESLDLTGKESAALVAFLKALTGEGYADSAPELFPE